MGNVWLPWQHIYKMEIKARQLMLSNSLWSDGTPFFFFFLPSQETQAERQAGLAAGRQRLFFFLEKPLDVNESLRDKSTALPSALHKAGAAFFYKRRSNANSAFFQGLSQLSQQRETIQVTPISCLSPFPVALPLTGWTQRGKGSSQWRNIAS